MAPAAPRSVDVSRRRNPIIDALRGVSILLVITHHLGLRLPLAKTDLATVLPRRVIAALNWNGYTGVFVFFVISGFLIARHSMRRWGPLQHIDMRAFYRRRFARIMPCLALLLVVLSILHWVGLSDFRIAGAGQSLGGALLAASGLHLNWYEGRYGYLPGNWDVLWSLSIEEAFYLAFPLACVTLRRQAVLALALFVLALSLPMALRAIIDNEIWKEKAYLPGMAAIAMGIVAALVAERFPQASTVVRRAVAAIGAAGLAAVALALPWLWRALDDGVMLLLTASTASLLLASAWAEQSGALPRLRGTGWLQSMGRLSYEVYLTHMFVVFAAMALFEALGAAPKQAHFWYPPVIGVAWALGWAVARAWSQPCERWLLRGFARRSPASASA